MQGGDNPSEHSSLSYDKLRFGFRRDKKDFGVPRDQQWGAPLTVAPDIIIPGAP